MFGGAVAVERCLGPYFAVLNMRSSNEKYTSTRRGSPPAGAS